ncbi:MAG: hypothetical protein HYU32_11530, partial [candidate division NC10 bacterium]|nr:hypothetical protein [candidate division NC10 bacterium]
FPHGHANGVVTVIAVVDRLDEGSVSWQIEREQAVLDGIREALERAAASRS